MLVAGDRCAGWCTAPCMPLLLGAAGRCAALNERADLDTPPPPPGRAVEARAARPAAVVAVNRPRCAVPAPALCARVAWAPR